MNIKRSVTFELTGQKENGIVATDNVLIRMVVTYSNKLIRGSLRPIIFSSGYRIDAGQWDVARQRVKNGRTNKQKQPATQINAGLSKYEGYLRTSSKYLRYGNIFRNWER